MAREQLSLGFLLFAANAAGKIPSRATITLSGYNAGGSEVNFDGGALIQP
jgi:hypothetical protein